ncbi:MAG: DNA repair protein RecO [Marinomonas foliarum]|jgi:DNA repair protein RecO (recombination protein O)|uniref:DNA repair protein RecO n=1 Tax=Marinomonas foliarum TaxID=491950 RepID=A0A369AFV5_9GAMM|nr:DNA repair protein RecO [Marinomonas foliarum]QRV24847.1 DNA repair protein RecO [Marinomonas foliarum]RCX08033.1 DNA replication and repair protein RecO [Marinomonas foliarum]
MRASAYVIHTRPFQDNKILLDVLTLEQGLVRGVWRLPKKEARVIPGPFLCYEMEFSGRSDLKTVKSLESLTSASSLEGLPLYAALYIHELLEKLLPINLPLPDVYELYKWLIESLYTGAPIAPLLRRFEVGLFSELGVAINMLSTSRGELIDANQLYQFHYKFGLRPYHGEIPKLMPMLFVEGQVALNYQAGKWMDKQVLSLAKELHRGWLDSLLNGKPVVARRLLPKQPFQGERHLGVPIFRALKV